MPRPIWSGSISFGLVNVPVRLVTATSPKDVRFHQLHGTDHSRIQQYLAALRAKDNALVLSTMLFDDEVVPLSGLEGVPDGVDLSEREVAMAEQLVSSLATDFEPAKYHDDYRQRVLDLIQAKAEGQVIAAPPVTEPATPVVDLVAALEASLAAAKAKSTDAKTDKTAKTKEAKSA